MKRLPLLFALLLAGLFGGPSASAAGFGFGMTGAVKKTVTKLDDDVKERKKDITGVLAGALNFTGPYPSPGTVTYVNSTGTTVTVNAFPGQVMVYFSTTVSQGAAEAAVSGNGGAVIGRIPLAGFYLARVAEGGEAAFIAAMRNAAGVRDALPNLALADEAVVINEDYVTQPIPLPINIIGPVVIDSGQHGRQVIDAAAANGTTVPNLIGVTNLLQNGQFSADKIQMTLAAIAQGASVFNPGQPVLINTSNGAGARLNNQWVDVNVLPTQALRDQAVANWEAAIRAKLEAIAGLPENLRRNLIVTQSAGNCNIDIAAALQRIKSDPVLRDALNRNMPLFGTVLTGTPNANYPTGAFSNHAVNDPNVIRLNNAQSQLGTSFAAPAGLAFLAQIMAQTGVTAEQAQIAMRATAFGGIFNLTAALAAAQQIRANAQAVQDQAGVSAEEANLAMELAILNNANGEFVLAEAVDRAQAIRDASETDPDDAYFVTGIAILGAGGTTTARITPQFSGVTVQYSVSGTDGYYDSGTLQTNGAGQVSFSIPAGGSGVTDTIAVTAVLSGASASTQFTW
jgi:hypothetical protein